MAMIGVPLMNNNINPYKKAPQRNKKTSVSNSEKSNSNSDIVSVRRRYQSECVTDNAIRNPKAKGRIKTVSESDTGMINSMSTASPGMYKKPLSSINKSDSVNQHINVKIADDQFKENPRKQKHSTVLAPITEEKQPSLNDLSEFLLEEVEVVEEGGTEKLARQRSLSLNAVGDLKMAAAKRKGWKKWNPLNKLWHQLKRDNVGTGPDNTGFVQNSSGTETALSSTSTSQTNCNCIR